MSYQENRNNSNSGALFPRQKKSQNSPDMGGDFTLDGAVLDYVLKQAQRGPVKLDVSAWRKMGRNNTAFTSIKIDIPWSVRKESMPDRQQPNYQRASIGGEYRSPQRPLEAPRKADVEPWEN